MQPPTRLLLLGPGAAGAEPGGALGELLAGPPPVALAHGPEEDVARLAGALGARLGSRPLEEPGLGSAAARNGELPRALDRLARGHAGDLVWVVARPDVIVAAAASLLGLTGPARSGLRLRPGGAVLLDWIPAGDADGAGARLRPEVAAWDLDWMPARGSGGRGAFPSGPGGAGTSGAGS